MTITQSEWEDDFTAGGGGGDEACPQQRVIKNTKHHVKNVGRLIAWIESYEQDPPD